MWAVVAIVAGLSLAVATGAFSGGHAKAATLYQRTMQVAGQYRCPVCAGESVAASDAAEAVESAASYKDGWRRAGAGLKIRSYLVNNYGPSILEKPPASGIGVLIWVLPVVFGLLSVLGLVLVFAHWRRAGVVGVEPYEQRPRRLGTGPLKFPQPHPGHHRCPGLRGRPGHCCRRSYHRGRGITVLSRSR